MKNKKLVAGVIVIGALIAGFYALNSYIYNEKQADEAVQVSLEGIVVCLPHKGPGPHSKECMVGLMTPDRLHYALDLSQVASSTKPLQVSDRLSAQGTVTPAGTEEKYNIAGTFLVLGDLMLK
jgi:hypothetical protein